jgi:pimeloyl-ACP methyl ester carboxylesterase
VAPALNTIKLQWSVLVKNLFLLLMKFVLVPILVLIIVAVGFLLGRRAWLQNSVKERRTITEANGIEILEEINIGGLKQWIQVRGRDKNNPILLFLHGGPGAGFLGVAHTFQDAWEDHFTVVQWDQRGAGKSFNGEIPRSSMTLEQMKADTIEVVQYLRKRFNREKIFLMGYSWGSYLGVHAIKKNPEWFFAYIGVGQVVNMREGEKVSYDYTIRIANDRGNNEALEQLLSLAPYPSENMTQKLGLQRNWLVKFNGSFYHETSTKFYETALRSAPEYSIFNFINYRKGLLLSVDALWGPFMESDMTTLGYDFQVPVFFFSGRYDYQVPADLAFDYFDKIQAPYKEFVWFEDSAHSPMIEETEKFSKELVKRVLPIAGITY